MYSTGTGQPVIPEFLLVIGHSGRMLAEAAVAVDIKPLVIDVFADTDTRSHALEVSKIPELNAECVEPAIDELTQRYPVHHAVYGSGLENVTECLDILQQRMVVLGNDPDVFLRIQNKCDFFSVLAELCIPFPKTVFTAPKKSADWLVKPLRGQGGVGVERFHTARSRQDNVYWQQYLKGGSYSVLFVADGRDAQVVGFNRQWSVCFSNEREFLFSGIVNQSGLGDAEQNEVCDWVRRCVPAFGLKGLNSLDFLKSGHRCFALEINARPPASMPLYPALLERHLLAAQGCLIAAKPEAIACGGVQVVYAEDDLMVPRGFTWPEGAKDCPDPGVICRKGEPICSIIAHHDDERQVMIQLNMIQTQIINQMIKV